MIINLHGFASNGNGLKSQAIHDLFGKCFSPNLPVSPKETVEMLEEKIYKSVELGAGNISIIGTSMGGFYAKYLIGKMDLKGLIINPVIEPSVTMKRHLGVNTFHKTGDTFDWTEKHIEELQLLEIEAESFEYLKSSTKVILGTQDTVINIANTKKYFEERYFKVYEYESDHRFTSKFKEVINEFSDFLLTGNIC